MSRIAGGWIKSHRGQERFFGSNSQLKFRRLGLFNSLCMAGSIFPIEVVMNKEMKSYPAGTIVTSIHELAGSKAKADLKWVRRDLDFLKSVGLIDLESGPEGHAISIKNWNQSQENLLEKEVKKGKKMRHQPSTVGAPLSISTEEVNYSVTSENHEEFNFDETQTENTRHQNGTSSSPFRGPIKNKNKNQENTNTHVPLSENGNSQETDTTKLWNFYKEQLLIKRGTRAFKNAADMKLCKTLICDIGFNSAMKSISAFLADDNEFFQAHAYKLGLFFRDRQVYVNRACAPVSLSIIPGGSRQSAFTGFVDSTELPPSDEIERVHA